MKWKRFWRTHKVNIGFGVLILLALGFSHQDIKESIDGLSEQRRVAAENAKQVTALEQSQLLAEGQAKVANQRYEQGCLVIASPNTYTNGNQEQKFKFVSIVPDLEIRDRVTNKLLPDGTLVCDGQGNTGIIKDGKPGEIAYTGNRELIKRTLERFGGTTQQYSQPTVPTSES